MLGYKDAEVWQLTPRFLFSQLVVHNDVQKAIYGGTQSENTKASNKGQIGYIDNMPGWG